MENKSWFSWLLNKLGLINIKQENLIPPKSIEKQKNLAANSLDTNLSKSNAKINSESKSDNETFNLLEIAGYDQSSRRIIGNEWLGEEGENITRLIREHFNRGLAQLPAFPILATEIFEAVRKKDAQVNQIVSLISRDPAICAHVLKTANSVFSSSREPIRSLRDAVTRIGLRETANAAATALSGPLFDPETTTIQGAFRPLWDRLWQHSIVTGSTAGKLAVEWHVGDPMSVFLSGILHDIGKTFALRALGSLVIGGKIAPPSIEATEYLVEMLHVEMGLEAARVWRLPKQVIAACELHHASNLDSGQEWDELHLLRIVSGADEVRLNPLFSPTLQDELFCSIRALGFEPKLLRSVALALIEQSQKNPTVTKSS